MQHIVFLPTLLTTKQHFSFYSQRSVPSSQGIAFFAAVDAKIKYSGIRYVHKWNQVNCQMLAIKHTVCHFDN